MSYIFNTFFYNPLYNALVFLIDITPGGDAGIAVVLLTIVVSFFLFSISKKAIRSQIRMKEIEPELALIRKIEDKQEQARQMLALYKKNNINPFSMILMMLIQIPILFALYYVFFKGGLPSIHTDLLYSFVKIPSEVNMNFLGMLDISKKNVFMAIFAGITQFIQGFVMVKKTPKKSENPSFSEGLAHSMGTQMKYTLPVIIGAISLSLPSALPLYWSTRNIFTTIQELILKKKKEIS